MIDVSVCVPVYRSHPPPDVATLASDLPAALGGLAGELVVALNGIPPEAAGAGGFDEAYAPFSYEEADYCTAVRLDLGLGCYAVAGVGHDHAFGVSATWRPLRRIAFDGRSERVWRIDRRNRRRFLEKWSDRAAAGRAGARAARRCARSAPGRRRGCCGWPARPSCP